MIRNNMDEDYIFDWMIKIPDTSQSSHLRTKLTYDKNFLPKLTQKNSEQAKPLQAQNFSLNDVGRI
jgi:hypothetical protein